MVNTVSKMVAPFNITCAKSVTSVSAIKQAHLWLAYARQRALVSLALKMRAPGMGVRASSRVLDKSLENLPPSESFGWTLTCIERDSGYWVTAQVGRKDERKFIARGHFGVGSGQTVVSLSAGKRDGERRYAQELWKIASVRLKYQDCCAQYGHLKVWREGLEVAIKIKGSQGKPRVEWVKPEHPFTAISLASEVHANSL